MSVAFVDSEYGWLLGRVGCGTCVVSVLTTIDGGQSWQSAPDLDAGPWNDTNPRQVTSLAFATRSDGWAYGRGLFVTHDGGASWSDETASDRIIVDLQANAGVAWRLDRTRTCPTDQPGCVWTLQLSNDGGRSWQPASEQPPLVVQPGRARLAVRSPTEAWINAWSDGPAGRPNGQLLVTRDAGASWQERPHPCAGGGYDESFAPSLDGQQLWLVCGGQPGVGQQPKKLFVSADDGVSWLERGRLVWSGYVGPLVALSAERAFWGETRGGGVVFGTRDGGWTWQADVREPENGDSLTAPLGFVDAGHGWIVSIGAVWRTTDGGESWQRTPVGDEPGQAMINSPP
jgi:photosystem II stability/assembly factor-like uncharacterized protein